jgi:hypothetical protein
MIPSRVPLALVLVMVAVLLAAGCAGQQDVRQNTATVRTTPVSVITALTTPPGPSITFPSPTGNQVYLDNVTEFLGKWNGKMHWGFSSRQLESFNSSLQTTVLEKYRLRPGSLTLNIPDIKTFCLEVGDAIGLSKNQSEEFANAADKDLKEAKIDFLRRSEENMMDGGMSGRGQ